MERVSSPLRGARSAASSRTEEAHESARGSSAAIIEEIGKIIDSLRAQIALQDARIEALERERKGQLQFFNQVAAAYNELSDKFNAISTRIEAIIQRTLTLEGRFHHFRGQFDGRVCFTEE